MMYVLGHAMYEYAAMTRMMYAAMTCMMYDVFAFNAVHQHIKPHWDAVV